MPLRLLLGVSYVTCAHISWAKASHMTWLDVDGQGDKSSQGVGQ